jgi:hypothetical protein
MNHEADREAPSRDGNVTATCPMCGTVFVPAPNQVYCKHACGAKAWRRRHQVADTPIVVPPSRPHRPITVYECEACGTRSVGDQRCDGCGSFMRRIGFGGYCPHCDGAVAVADLLPEEVVPKTIR